MFQEKSKDVPNKSKDVTEEKKEAEGDVVSYRATYPDKDERLKIRDRMLAKKPRIEVIFSPHPDVLLCFTVADLT